jgi:hypothetical protein
MFLSEGRNRTMSRRRLGRIAGFQCVLLLAGCIAVAAAQAPPPPIDNFDALGAAIMSCWKPPAGSEGFEITLRFGLTGQGALRGSPMVTYAKLFGSKELQQAFALSALQAVTNCTPVKLTGRFGPIVAQRVLTLRFAREGARRVPI